MKTTYKFEAEEFLRLHDAKFKIIGEPVYRKFFSEDKEARYVFKLRLQRKKMSATFLYGQSIYNGCQEPCAYDLLANLTKYDPGSFDDFCADYGYSNDSIASLKVYKEVKKEFKKVNRLFFDCFEELLNID